MSHVTELTPQVAIPRSTPTGQGNLSRRNACLSALSSEALSLLKPYLTEAAFSAGSVLWGPNKLSSNVYFPMSGLISIMLPMSDGVSVEVGNIGCQAAAGTVFEASQPEFSTQGEVRISGRFVCMPGLQLLSASEKNREIENLVAYCRDWTLMQAQQAAACTATHTADKRLCRWLVQACESANADVLDLTQETIASTLGIRRTSVTLLAQKLKTEGLIQYRRGHISVSDLARLRAAACECCNSYSRHRWPSTRLANLSHTSE